MLVALLIVYASWAIVKPAIFELSDGGASFEVIKDIRASVAAVPEVKSVHGIRTRKHGSEIYIDLHIMVDESLTVRQGHDIARIVRRKALDDVPCTADVLVHVEPFEEDHLKT
jgi:divalent metal cation (Fe/Co/Zn/Cd) transporter